jgi:RNA polymerase sigma-70 factor (ECF subfamily)
VERILTQGRQFAPLVRPAMVNGAPGTVAERDGKILGATAYTVRNGRIATMDLVIDPDRFRGSSD